MTAVVTATLNAGAEPATPMTADSRAPRDGKFIEIVGTYNPLLSKDSAERVKFKAERLEYWLSTGAQPTVRTQKLIKTAGLSSK